MHKKVDFSRYKKWAFVRADCLGEAVEQTAGDSRQFSRGIQTWLSSGEVIPVIEKDVQSFDRAGHIITITADGVLRYVSKEWITILDGYDPGEKPAFMSLEDAADIVKVGMNLFLDGKSVHDRPYNSMHVFETAAGVVTDYFVNRVFGDEE